MSTPVNIAATTIPEAPAETGSLFRLATAGSVDDGKSTLIGRLLHDAQAILTDQLEAVARSSAERGFGTTAAGPVGTGGEAGVMRSQTQALDLALLTDGLRAEREQGITIDVAYRYFATDRRSFVLADCPGHVQYTRNTVTGTSTADAVVLLVDVRHGVVEQTRRHLAVATLLRVEHVIVAVNKIDAVNYSEEAFRAVEQDIHAVARELRRESGQEWAGLRDPGPAPEPIVIPVSALYGDNIVTPSEHTPWYRPGENGNAFGNRGTAYAGQALLPVLEQLPDADAGRRSEEPLRLPVQTVIRPQTGAAPDYRGYAGQIASGFLQPGDQVRIQPGAHLSEVTAVHRTSLQQRLSSGELHTRSQGGTAERIDRTDQSEAASDDLAPSQYGVATPGESVVVELADQYDVARGSVLTDPRHPATELSEVTLRVAWLGDEALTPGARVLFKHGTATVKALVSEISDRLDLTTLNSELTEELALNDIGTIRIKLASVLPVDDYSVSKRTGASLLIDPADGNTLAAGLIRLPAAGSGQDQESDEEWLT